MLIVFPLFFWINIIWSVPQAPENLTICQRRHWPESGVPLNQWHCINFWIQITNYNCKNDNDDDDLVAGANWMIRKMAGAASPVLEITQDEDTFGVKLQSMFHSKDQSFKIGETFEETQQNGVIMKVSPCFNLYPSWVLSQRPFLGHLCINWRGKG